MEKCDKPVLRRYTTNDPSPAALGHLLIENPNGILVARDELVSLLQSFEREDNSEARGFYLTGWSGQSPYTIDRIGRGTNLHIPGVCISLIGTTQPGKIAKYVASAMRGGAGDDGLIQRFGLAVWPDVSPDWQNVDKPLNAGSKREAFQVYDRLDQIDLERVGAKQDTDYNGKPDGLPYLRFDGEALEIFTAWRTTLELRLRGGSLHQAIEFSPC